PSGRPLIEGEAAGCEHVFVVEPPLPDGALKTARKGVGRFTVEVEGLAAHAGVEPEKGVSAIEEMAHQVLHLHALGDPEAGATGQWGGRRGGDRRERGRRAGGRGGRRPRLDGGGGAWDGGGEAAPDPSPASRGGDRPRWFHATADGAHAAGRRALSKGARGR